MDWVLVLNKKEDLTIDSLKSIKKATKDKLKKAGIFFLKDVLMFNPLRLSETANISPETAEKIIEETLDLLEKSEEMEYGFEKASRLLAKENLEKKTLHTGSKNLDNILQGGYSVGEVTELAGAYRTGKTQACLTALATVFLSEEEGGLNDGDVYAVLIDAEHTFSPKRMEPIFQRFDIDPRWALDRILVGKPKNSLHQLKMIENLVKLVKEKRIKLVVVDSLTKLPRADFSGRGELYERQRIILSIVEKLRRIAEAYNIVALVTNQVVAVPDASPYSKLVDKEKPIGGHVLAHTVDTRLYLSFVKEDIRRVEIIDSSRLPPAVTRIRISEAGITDPLENT
ncbi:MAG: DNA repair and recombination protein RadA [Candidatus Njordarchaeales archaeon]